MNISNGRSGFGIAGIASFWDSVKNSFESHVMFVETDDMSKFQDLLTPVIGYWQVEINPVRAV